MKKLGFLALLLSLGTFSLGCAKTEEPAGGETAPQMESPTDTTTPSDAPAEEAPK